MSILGDPDTLLDPYSEPLRIEFKTELEQLPPLAERWEALNLCRSDHDAPFFQSYAWNYHVARVRCRGAPNDQKLLVATVWRGSDLIGLWPLILVRSWGIWIARSLDDPFGQFAGVLFRDRRDIAPGVAAVLRELRQAADGLVVEAVLSRSALHSALVQCGARSSEKQQAVFVDVRPYRTFRDYEQDMKGETRRRLRNRAKRFREAHNVVHSVVTERTSLERIVCNVFDGRVEWLRRNGRTSPAFRDENYRTLLSELPGASGIDLIGFSLIANEAELSTHWGFVYAGRYYWYMSAMTSGYDKFSPGLLHLGMVIEACIDRDLEGLELMPPASRYKLEWSDKIKDVETMIVAVNPRRRAAFHLATGLVPAARRLSRMLPEPLRKSLVRRLNRG